MILASINEMESGKKNDEAEFKVEKLLLEYEESRKEHELERKNLLDALELKRKVIHYQELTAMTLNIEKEVSSGTISRALAASDILTGRQKKRSLEDSQESINQRMKLEMNGLKQEVSFWRMKYEKLEEEKEEENNSNNDDNYEEESENGKQKHTIDKKRRSIKFSRRLVAPKSSNIRLRGSEHPEIA